MNEWTLHSALYFTLLRGECAPSWFVTAPSLGSDGCLSNSKDAVDDNDDDNNDDDDHDDDSDDGYDALLLTFPLSSTQCLLASQGIQAC